MTVLVVTTDKDNKSRKPRLIGVIYLVLIYTKNENVHSVTGKICLSLAQQVS